VIIGRTGSGKTTIAQLLLRMYDPDHGKILMDGTDLRRFDLQDLRRQISYVPQDVFLFSDTVTVIFNSVWTTPIRKRSARPPITPVSKRRSKALPSAMIP